MLIISLLTASSCKAVSDANNADAQIINSENSNTPQKAEADKSKINTTTTSGEIDEFSVITIGTGTPAHSEIKANASTAIKYNDKYFIIDCGEGSYDNLLTSGFDFKNVSAIFFTHHHIDHTGDFFDIYIKCLQSNNKIDVVGPPRTQKFVDFVSDVYLDDILYRKSSNTKNNDSLKEKIQEKFLF